MEPLQIRTYWNTQGDVKALAASDLRDTITGMRNNGQDDIVFVTEKGDFFHATNPRFPDEFREMPVNPGLRSGDALVFRGEKATVVAYDDEQPTFGEKLKQGALKTVEGIAKAMWSIGFRT